MADGMMGRGPARRGRLSDEQRARIQEVRQSQGRGAARAMRRDMRQEAGLPVRQRQPQQNSMADVATQMPMEAPQSPMVMGQPTGDMMAYRPMPTQQPGMAPLSPGFGAGATQGIAAALGKAALGGAAFEGAQQQPMPITDMMYRPSIHGTPEQMQAMRDRYTQIQPPMQQSVQPAFNANMPAMQPGMNTGFNPMLDRARSLFAKKQALNTMNPSFNRDLAGARFY